MSDLDDRLRTLRRHAHEWGTQLRSVALDVEREPGLISSHLDKPALRYLAKTLIPPEFDDDPIRLGRYVYQGADCIERVVAVEEIASGDAGMLLAAPGASLSGALVHVLGDQAQREWYFSRLRKGHTWTFFGLTEPGCGSDAGAMTTTLRPDGDGYVLNGEKRYVGNATRAQMGVVFARTGPGPLGVAVVLVETDAPGFHATALPTVGLRAAKIGGIVLDGVRVAPEFVLGRHLPAAARGILGAARTFNQMRPSVAAIALGIARAAIDYAEANCTPMTEAHREELDRARWRIHSTRLLVWRAARAVDRDPREGQLASAAKARAAQLAEETTLLVLRLFSPGARFEHPYLDKLARDARGVEFMEGVRNVQWLSVSRALLGGRFPGA